jgi:hypothetical protein
MQAGVKESAHGLHHLVTLGCGLIDVNQHSPTPQESRTPSTLLDASALPQRADITERDRRLMYRL